MRAGEETRAAAGVVLREAAAGDVPEVVALVESAYRGDSSRAGWTTEADLLDGRRTDAAAEHEARTVWGSREVQMTVISVRAELVAWYERRGYRRTGEKRPFPYGDERFGLPRRPDLEFVVLAKPLP